MGESTEREIQEYEKMGEEELRLQIGQGSFLGNPGLAAEWLRMQRERREAEASSRRDAREERTLEIASSASHKANIAIIMAATLAALSAITSAIIQVTCAAKK